MSQTGWALSIDAEPYLFATAGVVALPTSTDPDWCAQWTLASGWLDPPTGTYQTRLATPDQEYQAGGMTFRVQDLPADAGPYAGQLLGSYLFARRPRNIPRGGLDANGLPGTTATTFTLASTADAAKFPTGSQVVWVDAEAVLCDSRSGAVFTVNANGRGYYGSRAVPHFVDSVQAYTPFAWSAPPPIQKRRALLWRVVDGVASVYWRGRVNQPRLADDGARYELAGIHTSAYHKDLPIGFVGPRLWLMGFDASAIRVRTGGSAGGAYSDVTGAANTAFDTLDQALAAVTTTLRASAALYSHTASTMEVHADGDGIVATITSPNTATDVSISVAVGPAFSPVVSGPPVVNGSTQTATAEVRPAPSALVIGKPNPVNSGLLDFNVGDTGGLPASWAGTSVLDGPFSSSAVPVLRGEYDKDWALVLSPTSVAGGIVTGQAQAEPRTSAAAIGAVPLAIRDGYFIVDREIELKLAVRVRSWHWLRAIQRGLLPSTPQPFLQSAADPRDWGFASANATIAATISEPSLQGIDYYADGSTKIGPFITDLTRLHGCSLAAGPADRLDIVALREPLPTDTVAATFTAADYVAGKAVGYTTLLEALANSCDIDADSYKEHIDNRQSMAQYGPALNISLKLLGSANPRGGNPDPHALAQYAMQRLLGRWGEPAELFTLPLPSDLAEGVYDGSYVTFDAPEGPDGIGGRGLVAQTGQALGRQVNFDEGITLLEVIVYPIANVAGYAPAVRVTGISGAVLTIGTGYLTASSATDFAGSNLSTYRYAATHPNDGGATYFTGAKKARLRQYDSAAPAAVSAAFRVLSISYGPPVTITLDAAPPASWQTIITGGGWVNLVLDRYLDQSTAPFNGYAFVGSQSAGVIDGTASPLQVFTP